MEDYFKKKIFQTTLYKNKTNKTKTKISKITQTIVPVNVHRLKNRPAPAQTLYIWRGKPPARLNWPSMGSFLLPSFYQIIYLLSYFFFYFRSCSAPSGRRAYSLPPLAPYLSWWGGFCTPPELYLYLTVGFIMFNGCVLFLPSSDVLML